MREIEMNLNTLGDVRHHGERGDGNPSGIFRVFDEGEGMDLGLMLLGITDSFARFYSYSYVEKIGRAHV